MADLRLKMAKDQVKVQSPLQSDPSKADSSQYVNIAVGDQVKAQPSLKTNKKTYAADFIPCDFDRAVYLGNPHIDNLYDAVMALGANLWAAQRRLKIHEAVLAKHGKLTTELVEQYQPSVEETAAWNAERNVMVTQIFDAGRRRQDVPYGSDLRPPIAG